MVDERVTTTDDGVTSERVVERTDSRPDTVYVEKSGGGGGLLVGLLILVALAIGAWFLLAQNNSEVAKDNAMTEAATKVGDAAENVGQAAQDAGDAAKDAVNGQ